MRCTFLPLLLVTSSVPTWAQTPQNPAAGDRAAGDLSAGLQAIVDETGAPGVVALALVNGEVRVQGAGGVRRLGAEDKLRVGDAMHLGSCGKAITATLVARLVEAEDLRWDTTLAEALPDLAANVHADYGAATVLELLQHRAGIAERRRPEIMNFGMFAELDSDPQTARRQLLERTLTEPALPIGEGGHDYSNLGYMAAAAICEARTGKSWEELIGQQVFEPVGLGSAAVGSPAGDSVAVGHRSTPEGPQPLDPGPGGELPGAFGPAGLVSCSLEDWGRFAWDALGTGSLGERLLQDATYAALQTPPDGSNYAAGWAHFERTWAGTTHRAIGHSGSDGTWFSTILVLPQAGVVVISASNSGPPSGQQATDRALEAALAQLETMGVAVPNDELAIREQSARFSAAFVDGDAETMVAIYTEDAVIAPPGMGFLSGKQALLDYWSPKPGRRVTRHQASPERIEVHGDIAYDYGHYSGATEVQGQTSNWGGKYLIVWRRGADGVWRMAQDMWNDGAPK